MRRYLDEAVRQSAFAEESAVDLSDDEEVRGGSPARRFLSAPGGELQDAVYAAPGMLQLIAHASGLRAAPTSNHGSYTYYARPGDHLTLHRDVEACDLAVITCLSDSNTTDGGQLHLYPDRTSEPLSAIRARPSHGLVTLKLRAGSTLLMYGGIVPHAVTPVDAQQVRIVSVLCYRI